MNKATFTITPGVVIEYIGHEAVVMLPGSSSVMRVSEEQAHALRAIEAGHTSGLSTQAVQSLIDAGIVVTHTGMSRRNLVKAGAIGAGAGIAVMAMPTVAAASSPGDEGGGGDEPDFLFVVVSETQNGYVNEVRIPSPPLVNGSPIVFLDGGTPGTLRRGATSLGYTYFSANNGAWIPNGAPSVLSPPETFEIIVDGVTYRGVYSAG